MTCLQPDAPAGPPIVYWRPLWSKNRTILVQLFAADPTGPIELATVTHRVAPWSSWGPTITLEPDPEKSTGGRHG